jgi:hypothetical protein
MVVIHPDLKSRTVTTRLSHHALSAAVSRLGRARPLRDADQPPDVLAAFGLT